MMHEELAAVAKEISVMDRAGLIRMMRRMRCGFTIDFSNEFLEATHLDRLRHIVLAARVHEMRLRAKSSQDFSSAG